MKMREYETLFIFRPDTTEEEINKVVERVKAVIDERNGGLLQARSWGKRKLAYEVQKHLKGTYFYARYVSLGDTVDEIERYFKMIESVIKFQSVKLADDVELEARMAEFSDDDVPPPQEVTIGHSSGMDDRKGPMRTHDRDRDRDNRDNRDNRDKDRDKDVVKEPVEAAKAEKTEEATKEAPKEEATKEALKEAPKEVKEVKEVKAEETVAPKVAEESKETEEVKAEEE